MLTDFYSFFHSEIQQQTRAPGCNMQWFVFLIPELYKIFVCLLNVFLTFFLTYLFPYLTTSLKIGLFFFQAGGPERRPNLVLFLCLFYVVVYFVTDTCLLLLLYWVFSIKPWYWLWRTSPKWPILWRVGRKTLTESIVWPHAEYVARLSCEISTLGGRWSGFSASPCAFAE